MPYVAIEYKGKRLVKRYTKKDPFLLRETDKYENPIPSREFICDYLDEIGHAVSNKHLIAAFGLETEESIEALRRRLRAMERDGQIISNRRNQYALVKRLELVRGVVIGRKDGYGFLIPDDGSSDLYLSSYQMRLVFPNDIVLARVSNIDSRGRKEGTIVEILERNTQHIVGCYRQEGGVFYVHLINENVRITPDDPFPSIRRAANSTSVRKELQRISANSRMRSADPPGRIGFRSLMYS